IRDFHVTGVQTCALPIFLARIYGGPCVLVQEKPSPPPPSPGGRAGGKGYSSIVTRPSTRSCDTLPEPSRSTRKSPRTSETSMLRSEERRVGTEVRAGWRA